MQRLNYWVVAFHFPEASPKIHAALRASRAFLTTVDGRTIVTVLKCPLGKCIVLAGRDCLDEAAWDRLRQACQGGVEEWVPPSIALELILDDERRQVTTLQCPPSPLF
jgi:hypothetical protein